MKNVLLFAFAAGLLWGCTGNKNMVTLSGKITNPNSDKIEISNMSGFKKEISLKEDGTFRSQFEAEKGIYDLFDGAEYGQIHLENGNNINITFNAKEFDETMSFQGKGSEESNYIAKAFLFQEQMLPSPDHLFVLSNDEFEERISTVRKEYDKLLAAKGLDEEFITEQRARIENQLGYYEENYDEEHSFLMTYKEKRSKKDKLPLINTSFKVYGNCGMCGRRIEKAAILTNGVYEARWDQETKLVKVSFLEADVKQHDIEKNIAAVGHDTDAFSAPDDVYSSLPGCCLYDRAAEMAARPKATGNETTANFTVYGNCGMCKSRIVKAAFANKGVVKADWDSGTKLFTVAFDENKVSRKDIEKSIAAVGHDTDNITAPDDVYSNLPGCCLYDRPDK